MVQQGYLHINDEREEGGATLQLKRCGCLLRCGKQNKSPSSEDI